MNNIRTLQWPDGITTDVADTGGVPITALGATIWCLSSGRTTAQIRIITPWGEDKTINVSERVATTLVNLDESIYEWYMLWPIGISSSGIYFVVNYEKTTFGFIDINSVPQSAKIFIDDIDTGQTTPAIIKTATGLHTIKLVVDRYDDYTESVSVPENGTIYLTANMVFNPQKICSHQEQIATGSVFIDNFNGKIQLDSVVNTTTAVVTITTPWGEVIPSVTVNEGQIVEYAKNYLKYQVNIVTIYSLGALDVSTCYLDATPSEIPPEISPDIPPEEKTSPLILLGMTAVAGYVLYMLMQK